MKSTAPKPSARRPHTSIPRPQSQMLIHKVDFRALISGLSPELLRNPLLAPPLRTALVPKRRSRTRLRIHRTPTESEVKRKGELVISAPSTSRGKSFGLLMMNYNQSATQRNLSHFPSTSDFDHFPKGEDKTRVSENSSILVNKEHLEAVLGSEEDIRVQSRIIRKPETEDSTPHPDLPKPRTRLIHSALSKHPITTHGLSQCEEFVLTSVPATLCPGRSSSSRLYFDLQGDIRRVEKQGNSGKGRNWGLRKTKTMASFGTQTSDGAGKRERIDVYLPEDAKQYFIQQSS